MRAGVPMTQFGWPGQVLKSSNDFYCEEDDVVRGCSMAHATGPDGLFSKPSEDGMAAGLFSNYMQQTLGMPWKDDTPQIFGI